VYIRAIRSEPAGGMERSGTMFIVEITTRTGKISESYASLDEARRRIECLPAAVLVDMPLIFQELADGSQRLIRQDGKPLQWHRLPWDSPPGPAEPIALIEGPHEVEEANVVEELPLPLIEPDENGDDPSP
jgi:hypothetical protein